MGGGVWVCWVGLSAKKVKVKGPLSYNLSLHIESLISEQRSKDILTRTGGEADCKRFLISLVKCGGGWGDGGISRSLATHSTLFVNKPNPTAYGCRMTPTNVIIGGNGRNGRSMELGGEEILLSPNLLLRLDGYQLSNLIHQVWQSPIPRKLFIKKLHQKTSLLVMILLKPPKRDFLDIMGNTIANSYLVHKCEMETALSWLSTLGGAFSALGDISSNWAEQAGQVSLTQFRIAMKLGDPLIASRCRLYAAISMLQRGSLKSARRVIRQEYQYAISLPERQDPKLIRMCFGVWAKLQYAWTMHGLDKKKGHS